MEQHERKRIVVKISEPDVSGRSVTWMIRNRTIVMRAGAMPSKVFLMVALTSPSVFSSLQPPFIKICIVSRYSDGDRVSESKRCTETSVKQEMRSRDCTIRHRSLSFSDSRWSSLRVSEVARESWRSDVLEASATKDLRYSMILLHSSGHSSTRRVTLDGSPKTFEFSEPKAIQRDLKHLATVSSLLEGFDDATEVRPSCPAQRSWWPTAAQTSRKACGSNAANDERAASLKGNQHQD